VVGITCVAFVHRDKTTRVVLKRVTGERAYLVRGGGAGGDADDHGAGGQPVLGLNELAVRQLVQDAVVHGVAAQVEFESRS